MQVRLGERYGKKTPVYIEGELLGNVYPNEIDIYHLEDDGEIDEQDYTRLKEETLIPRAKRYVMNLLVKSDKTETELRRKLDQAGYGDEISEAAIDYVKGFHYIDELRTAAAFIRTKIDSSSEKEIRFKLSEKGINDDTADLAFQQISEELEAAKNPDEDSFEISDNPELKAAQNFVRKKLGSKLSSMDELSYEERQKLMAAAYRKGFRHESIREALRLLGIDD